MVTLRVYFFHLIKQKQVIQRLSPACLTAINWYLSGQHSQSMAAFAQWGLCHPLASTMLAAEPWPLPVPDLVLKAEEKTASPLLASMVLGAEGHLLHPQLLLLFHQSPVSLAFKGYESHVILPHNCIMSCNSKTEYCCFVLFEFHAKFAQVGNYSRKSPKTVTWIKIPTCGQSYLL